MASKRKCYPQLPACERCVKKQIQCVYDLEPVAFSQSANDALCDVHLGDSVQEMASQKQRFQMVYDSVPNARDASASAMASGLGSDSSAAHPLLMADGDTAVWLMRYFTQVAQDALDGRASPFVHPRVVGCVSETDKPGCTELEGLNLDLLCLQEQDVCSTLARIYGLITTALQRLLLEKPSVKRELETERIVQCLFSTTHALWSTADALSLRGLPPCKAWRIAESIRRSMFAAIFVRGIWSVAVSGYCHYEPFLESLPFDPRVGLWEADTEVSWDMIINQKYQGQHTRLKSWHEFTEGTKSEVLNPDEDGQFQRMLYVSFHGSNGTRRLEELDARKVEDKPS